MRTGVARRLALLASPGGLTTVRGENLVQVGALLDGDGETLDTHRFLIQGPGLAQDDDRGADSDDQKAQPQKADEYRQ